MDVMLHFNGELLMGDVRVIGSDLARDESLQTAVLLSIFTHRLAEEDDELPYGEIDRRGWWGDILAKINDDRIGSRRWIYKREKQTTDTARKIREADEEALQWFIDDGIAASVSVTTEWVRRGWLFERILIQKPSGEMMKHEFEELWEAA